MEYNMCYALYNYERINLEKELSLRNLRLIREFEGSKSETGFVAVHIAMVIHTGKLVTAADNILTALKDKNR